MALVTIQPVKQRKEVITVLVASLLIATIAAILIANRKDAPELQLKLKKHQINAATDLNDKEFKVFSDLYGVGRTEIRNLMSETNGSLVFPAINILRQKQAPPFVGGFLYKRYGDHQWTFKKFVTEKTIRAVYIGKTQKPDIAGSFIFLIEGEYQLGGILRMDGIPTIEEQNNNLPPKKRLGTIWYKAGTITTPETYTRGGLTKDGWKEAVILTGKDKREDGEK